MLSVVVRAGPNMDARLDMLDPNGLRDAPGFDARNVFSVVNVGVVEQVPRFAAPQLFAKRGVACACVRACRRRLVELLLQQVLAEQRVLSLHLRELPP